MKHKTNRILSLFLALVLTAGLLPLAAHAEDPGTFAELQQEIDQIPSGGILELEKDYKCEDGFSADGIVIERSMTIKLNEHTIDGNGKARIFFVNNEVNFTLKGPGTITGGEAADGGGIYAGFNAALSLQNVEISGNHTERHGGGIYTGDNVTLSLQNVKISGNHTERYGGGIYAGADAALSLQNVEISGNAAKGHGGGIYAGADAALSLQNVEISGNHTEGQGGGVFLSSGAQGLEIGGETIVSGNTRISDGGTAADNVYLYGPQLTVTSPLTGKAKIGLSPDSDAISYFSREETFDRMMPLGTGFNTHHPEYDIEAFFVSDDPSICIGNRALNGYDMFCSRHTHQMECQPNPENGAELEYVCTAGSCPMPSPFAKLTLVAENRAYNGQKYDGAWLDDLAQFNQITGLNLVLFDDNGYYLVYWGGEDTAFSDSPLFPGSYWAVFRPAEGTIKKNFQITPAPLTIRPQTQNRAYNGELQGPGDMVYTGSEAAAAVVASGLADGDRVISVTIDGQGREVGTYELEITGLRIENTEGIDVTACYAITYEKGSLVIGKKPLTLGLTMDGWIAGEAASTPVLTGNEGNGDVTYEYKPQGANKKAYSTDVPTAAGEYTVRATVEETKNHLGGEKTADFTIFPALTGITLDSNSAKTKYFIGEALDVAGLVLTASYSDNSTKKIDVTKEMVSGFDSKTPGSQTLTVTYEGFEAKYEVEVKAQPVPVTLTGITLDSTAAKTKYFIGEALDVSGLVLTASYSDNSTKKIDVTKEMVSGFDSKTPGSQTLTVTYESFTDTYEVEVKAISYAAEDDSYTWQKGSGKNLDLTFRRSEDDHLTYGLFGSLEIGGVTVGSANYSAAEGSLKLSIKPEYLETLSVGDHTVKVNFQDGSATVKLTVKAAAENPKTGDESNTALWISLMFLSVAAMILLLLYTRKRKTEK